MARVLAIDYGDSRIGLAYGDTKEYLIVPYEVLSSGSFEDIYNQLKTVIEEKQVEEIVIGYPLNMKGEKTEQTKKVEEFADQLQQRAGLPIILEDERLTSVQAQKTTKGFFGSLWGGKAKDAVQKSSAVLILETYIEKKKSQEP